MLVLLVTQKKQKVFCQRGNRGHNSTTLGSLNYYHGSQDGIVRLNKIPQDIFSLISFVPLVTNVLLVTKLNRYFYHFIFYARDDKKWQGSHYMYFHINTNYAMLNRIMSLLQGNVAYVYFFKSSWVSSYVPLVTRQIKKHNLVWDKKVDKNLKLWRHAQSKGLLVISELEPYFLQCQPYLHRCSFVPLVTLSRQ